MTTGLALHAQIRFGFCVDSGGGTMAKGYSNDLRARVVGMVEAGESRRETARLLDIGVSTAIRCSNAGRGREASRRSRSPLETHKRWLLDLVAAEPDLTLDEIRARLACEKKLKTGKSSVGRFYERHDITFKKNSARRRAESA